MQERSLNSMVRKLWPDYHWTPIETGFERIYRCSAGGFEIIVEVRGGNSYVTIARYYEQSTHPVAVLGSSMGVSVEAIRRAYTEASMAWLLLQKLPPSPTLVVEYDLEEDVNYFKKMMGLE